MTDEEHEDDAEHETETTEHSDENSSVTDPAEVDREIVVIMTEFAFEPESVEVAAGETIRFVANNEGVIEHEIRFTTHHAAQEHIAAGHDDHEAEPDGHHEEMLLTVQPGASGDLVVAFDVADEFEIMACLLPGHFEAGMVADIVAR